METISIGGETKELLKEKLDKNPTPRLDLPRKSILREMKGFSHLLKGWTKDRQMH